MIEIFFHSEFVFSESAVQLSCSLRITEQIFIKIANCQSLSMN